MTTVDCLTCREALSARMDGETEPVPPAETDEHLDSCVECRAWQLRVEQISRMLRVREAPPVPDLSAAILDLAVPPQPTRGWWARIALIVVAVAQLGLALTQVLGVGSPGHDTAHAATPGAEHLFNESTAWNLAIGAALLWAAFRSRVTTGLIPVLGGVVLLLGVYSALDLATGTVPLTRVAEHTLLAVALALLILLNRRYHAPTPGHGAATDSNDGARTHDDELTDPTGQPPDGKNRPPLRPAGHHAA
jgi:predicted anti-sigma-YlaC factor YlaD